MNRHAARWFGIVGMFVGGWLMASSALAQPPGDGRQPPPLPDSAGVARMVGELSKELSLTGEQKQAVSALHFEHFAKLRALRETRGAGRDGGREADRESHREAVDALRTDLHERVAALLTPEQKTRFRAYLKARAMQRPDQGPRRR